jgi:hypothetical protein
MSKFFGTIKFSGDALLTSAPTGAAAAYVAEHILVMEKS